MQIRTLLLTFCMFYLTGCEQIAYVTTPKKEPKSSTSQLAAIAEKTFWDDLHSGNYHHINEAQRLLTAAYLENPNDPKLAAHLGFLHIWKITERQRLRENNPIIIDQIILAKRFFKDAVTLDPSDARFLGFLGDSTLIEGKILNDQREQVHGYYILKRAISRWPEFNYFTAGYVMSTLDRDSWQFKKGLEWQWKTLDVCTGTHIDRMNPDYRPYMAQVTMQGPKRACWNSWIAPHNFEGFFMNMGDMLVKSGDWQTGIKIYQNAKLSESYSSWPYRKALEDRISHAKENVAEFNQTKNKMMFNSGYGCMACHQRAVIPEHAAFGRVYGIQ